MYKTQKVSMFLSSMLGKHSHRGVLFGVLKIVLGLVLAYVIYDQIHDHLDSIKVLSSVLTSVEGIVALLLVVLLMPVNWFLEMKKWQYLVYKFQTISVYTAVKSTLSGVTLGLITPGRVGEYGGRLVGISPENRSKALLANGVNSISQNIPNISIGLLAVLMYSHRFLNISHSAFVGLLGLTLLVLGVLLFLFFNLEVIGVLKKYDKHTIVRQLLEQSSFLKQYTSDELLKVLAYSFARYIVYSSQYVMLILLMGITSDPFVAFLGVALIYFIQTGIPLPPVLSVLARGEVAIWVWSVCSGEAFSILSATFILWCINLVTPATLGMLTIWRSKL